MAGLSAAQKLVENGLSILILEARPRTGGRVLADSPNTGYAIDLGPEFIHGKPRQIWDIIDRQNLPVYEVSNEHWYKHNGVIAGSSDFFEGVDSVMGKLPRAQEEHPEDLSFAAFLEAYCDNDPDEHKRAATSFIEGFNAAISDRIGVSGLNIENDAEGKLGEETYRLLSGYRSLLAEFEKTLPKSAIQLDSVVKQINWSSGHVQIKGMSSGAPFSAEGRAAIVTLPLGVLKCSENSPSFVRFSPALSSKTDALEKLEMGEVVKVSLQFKQRVWENAKLQTHDGETKDGRELCFLHSEHEYFPTWWTMRPLHVPLIVGWCAGRRAGGLRGRDKEFILKHALESLSSALNLSVESLKSSLVECHYHDWQQDPFSLGAYSYVGVSGANAAKVLAEPLENSLFFAGEHTNWQGIWATVHGAMETGVRAANQVIAALAD